MTKPKISRLPWTLNYNVYVLCPKCKTRHKVTHTIVIDAEQKFID